MAKPTSFALLSTSASSAPPTLDQGSSNLAPQLGNHRLGAAILATVAEKQDRARAHDDTDDSASSSGQLRGGGNANSVYPEYIWEDEEIRRLAEHWGRPLPRTQRRRRPRKDVDHSADLDLDPGPPTNSSAESLETTEGVADQGGDVSANLATENPRTEHEGSNVKNARNLLRWNQPSRMEEKNPQPF
ncbi:hypothetical protein A1O7_08348 [Cladophialophora yegresii CBS 114405]|uniref:Uncharacterized protein n=1 Tax=Cladophialophora yegresii CBS 114405 TaxID=1182544 RepID=W9VTE8_9EURO|nr:uncharacterized protein A1O7_08348 [Cladophialophora yegresii CBS 114405]EXJ55421.1 hypothetical protein A1O7_08348 [Cladophialophora yegresii CBS 114405]